LPSRLYFIACSRHAPPAVTQAQAFRLPPIPEIYSRRMRSVRGP
jgi:hypothetical protein